MAYSIPSSAQPFTLHIPDQDLSDCLQLLRLSRVGPATWENTQTVQNFGVTRHWLSDAKDFWLNKFDWRAHESHINSFANYKMKIEDLDVHFIGYFSTKKDAIPIIFMHGWPGSFIEFLPMLDLVGKQYPNKDDLPYHIVVPSLPGYTLSSGGFTKYIAQGGDVGSVLARTMATMYDECVAVHLNLMVTPEPIDPENLSVLEKRSFERGRQFQESGTAYQQIQATRPSTIGHAVSSNPLSILAWIGEKFIEWSDTTPPLDHIILNIALYWFTDGYPRSIYPYRQIIRRAGGKVQQPKIPKPTGISFFAQELFTMLEPQLSKHCDLVQYRQHEKGGHFAALEETETFWDDVVEFVGKVWKV